MFDRIAYKKKAQEQLRGNRGVFALIALVYFFITYGVSFLTYDKFPPLALLSLCVCGIVEIAWIHVLLKNARKRPGEKITFADFIDGLSLWIKGCLAYLWLLLWIILWALVFFIPAFIKAVAYSQIFYVLADNPDISVRKALKMSMAMTKGYKGDLFVLYLSFLGWMLLSLFTCGILALWVYPYLEATLANTYLFLKEAALRTGTLSAADFMQDGGADGRADNRNASEFSSENAQNTTSAFASSFQTPQTDERQNAISTMESEPERLTGPQEQAESGSNPENSPPKSE